MVPLLTFLLSPDSRDHNAFEHDVFARWRPPVGELKLISRHKHPYLQRTLVLNIMVRLRGARNALV